jgi:hypothetical protein
MHYRTPRIGFLEEPGRFLERMPNIRRLDTPALRYRRPVGRADAVAVAPAAP